MYVQLPPDLEERIGRIVRETGIPRPDVVGWALRVGLRRVGDSMDLPQDGPAATRPEPPTNRQPPRAPVGASRSPVAGGTVSALWRRFRPCADGGA